MPTTDTRCNTQTVKCQRAVRKGGVCVCVCVHGLTASIVPIFSLNFIPFFVCAVLEPEAVEPAVSAGILLRLLF